MDNDALNRLVEVLINVASVQLVIIILSIRYIFNSVPIPFVLCDGS